VSLQITGQVISVLEERSGTAAKGEWRQQDFILETSGEYPKKVCIGQWGDRIDEFGVTVGETLTVHIDLKSREYNDRWYTDVTAWRIEKEDQVVTGRDDAPGGSGETDQDGGPDSAENGGAMDDLPF